MLRRSASLLFALVLFAGCNASSGDVPQGSLADGNAASGKELYVKHCSGCHGETGKGDGPGAANINPKPIDHTDKQYMPSLSDQHLFTVVRKGGSTVGRNAMPPFPNLTDQEIKDLIAFMRSISRQ
ncbi:MAG TPA: cytochrome c [Candidatus Kapabacteria bacterium]|nr:cytochrome c [Candidatus Kapabacteria bacterium]